MCPNQRQKKKTGKKPCNIILMYHTTPHTTTGTSLAQILFHHITNNGLPTIQPSKSTASNWETNYRERNKEYIDKKQFTKHKDFQIGEKVKY